MLSFLWCSGQTFVQSISWRLFVVRSLLISLYKCFEVIFWACRLSSFLLLRVLKAGQDNRFDEMRQHFWRFLFFWIFQMVWVFGVGLSLTLLNASDEILQFGDSPNDIAGLIMFILGLVIEALADQEKFNWRFDGIAAFKQKYPDKTPPIYKGGIWRYSRYFLVLFLFI